MAFCTIEVYFVLLSNQLYFVHAGFNTCLSQSPKVIFLETATFCSPRETRLLQLDNLMSSQQWGWACILNRYTFSLSPSVLYIFAWFNTYRPIEVQTTAYQLKYNKHKLPDPVPLLGNQGKNISVNYAHI